MSSLSGVYLALLTAASSGDVASMRRLCSVHPDLDLNQPIHWRTTFTQSTFYKADKDIQVVEEEEYFARLLHTAVLAGHLDVVAFLLEKGVNVNAIDGKQRSSLLCAIFGLDTLRASEHNLTYIATELPTHVSILRKLVKHPSVDKSLIENPQTAIFGMNLLCLAAHLDKLDCLKVLLNEAHITPDIKDANEATALMYAARDGRLRIVTELLKNGASPHIRDQNGFSAYDHCQEHYPEIAKLCDSAGKRNSHNDQQDSAISKADRRTKTLSQILCDAFPIPPPTPEMKAPSLPNPNLTKVTTTAVSPSSSPSLIPQHLLKINTSNLSLNNTSKDSQGLLSPLLMDGDRPNSRQSRSSMLSNEIYGTSALADELQLDIIRANIREIDLDCLNLQQRQHTFQLDINETKKEMEAFPDRASLRSRLSRLTGLLQSCQLDLKKLSRDREIALEQMRQALFRLKGTTASAELEMLTNELKEFENNDAFPPAAAFNSSVLPPSSSDSSSANNYDKLNEQLAALQATVVKLRFELQSCRRDCSRWKEVVIAARTMKKEEIRRAHELSRTWELELPDGRKVIFGQKEGEETDEEDDEYVERYIPAEDPQATDQFLEDLEQSHARLLRYFTQTLWQRNFVSEHLEAYSRELVMQNQRNEKLVGVVLERVKEKLLGGGGGDDDDALRLLEESKLASYVESSSPPSSISRSRRSGRLEEEEKPDRRTSYASWASNDTTTVGDPSTSPPRTKGNWALMKNRYSTMSSISAAERKTPSKKQSLEFRSLTAAAAGGGGAGGHRMMRRSSNNLREVATLSDLDSERKIHRKSSAMSLRADSETSEAVEDLRKLKAEIAILEKSLVQQMKSQRDEPGGDKRQAVITKQRQVLARKREEYRQKLAELTCYN